MSTTVPTTMSTRWLTRKKINDKRRIVWQKMRTEYANHGLAFEQLENASADWTPEEFKTKKHELWKGVERRLDELLRQEHDLLKQLGQLGAS